MSRGPMHVQVEPFGSDAFVVSDLIPNSMRCRQLVVSGPLAQLCTVVVVAYNVAAIETPFFGGLNWF
jgi:hypothetical protein